MDQSKGFSKIRQLRQTWISYQLLGDCLFSFAVAILLGSVLYYILGWQGWSALPVFVLTFAILSAIRQPWRITKVAVCNFLNVSYPELEESSELVIKPANTLNLLERLQCNKVEFTLQQLPDHPAEFTKRLKIAAILAIAAIVLSFVIAKIRFSLPASSGYFTGSSIQSSKNAPPEKVLPQIESVEIKITPPAYTGRPNRVQDKFIIQVEEASEINWIIHTNINIKNAFLLFNEKEKLPLSNITNDKKSWKAQKIITQPGFYQVSIDGKLSDFYQIQVIKDGPPVIRIKTPRQYTHIDAGEALKVNLTATLSDDYGITDALIYATVAKGSGEAVKFKEYKINFATSFKQHDRQYSVQNLFNLPAFNMEPGDELYFYIEAEDNHHQKSRTDAYVVSIQDTAQLLSMDGLINGSNIKPEYFRSERQIILETEALLKGRDTIKQDVFKTRCNDLGIDQKLLRLRYGKFLGEEDESGTAETNDDLGKAENFGNAKMVMDAYTDKHDNAEDATFLEPAIKAQLKATLTEMWKAELQLRMYKPSDALPFEYKALRLLKDLQQKSRSYVAKTAYNPPPIKNEKRLSGDLSKISQPLKQQDIKAVDDGYGTLKKSVTILEQLKYTASLNNSDRGILQLAGQQLSAKASAEPGIYLPAVAAMHRVLAADKGIHTADIVTIEKAIQKTLPSIGAMPSLIQTTPDMGLSKSYYKYLNQLNR
ncbi:MAG: hypothetical protein JWR12_2814 [Mucilaginibacter sp.]|nr:hypothetical protein [Mucilaginibacter sp.]